MRGRREAEGVCHPDLGRLREQDECVRVVQTSIRVCERELVEPERDGRLRYRRRPSARDDREVDVPSHVEVEGVQGSIVSGSVTSRRRHPEQRR